MWTGWELAGFYGLWGLGFFFTEGGGEAAKYLVYYINSQPPSTILILPPFAHGAPNTPRQIHLQHRDANSSDIIGACGLVVTTFDVLIAAAGLFGWKNWRRRQEVRSPSLLLREILTYSAEPKTKCGRFYSARDRGTRSYPRSHRCRSQLQNHIRYCSPGPHRWWYTLPLPCSLVAPTPSCDLQTRQG